MKSEKRIEKPKDQNDRPSTVTFEYPKGSLAPRVIYINTANADDQSIIEEAINLLIRPACRNWVSKLFRRRNQ